MIGGELKAGKSPAKPNLEINDKTFPVILGHRRASFTGFTISDLKPGSTEVYVWGALNSEGTLLTRRIEFRPVIAAKVDSNQISTSPSSSKK